LFTRCEAARLSEVKDRIGFLAFPSFSMIFRAVKVKKRVVRTVLTFAIITRMFSHEKYGVSCLFTKLGIPSHSFQQRYIDVPKFKKRKKEGNNSSRKGEERSAATLRGTKRSCVTRICRGVAGARKRMRVANAQRLSR